MKNNRREKLEKLRKNTYIKQYISKQEQEKKRRLKRRNYWVDVRQFDQR
jgi:hypothetical protein